MTNSLGVKTFALTALIWSLCAWADVTGGAASVGSGGVMMAAAASAAGTDAAPCTNGNPCVPRMSMSVKPATVAAGGSANIWWSAKNTSSCTASGGWSGLKPTDGTESTGPLTATTTYTLVCTGDGGSISRSVTVTVTSTAPTLSLTANPSSVTAGGSATLSWSSTNATSCTASGGWTGAKPASGSEPTGALTTTTIYTLDCSGDGGSVSRSVTVTVTAPPAPTLTLTANPVSVITGSSSTLSWSSTNANSCTASGGWNGPKGLSGAESTGVLAATTTFTLDCTGDGGSVSKSVTVTVTAVPPPTLTLTANPLSVTSGASSTLSWTTTDADDCTAHDGWSGAKATNGSESTGALAGTTSYTLECTGPGGTIWQTVVVAVVTSETVTRPAAFRFLNQASFGPTESSVAELATLGGPEVAFARWIDGQMVMPASLQLPLTQSALAANPSNPFYVAKLRRSKWFDDAINGPDQLRQRVAFALSQILVVSEYGALWRLPLAVASYNDLLVEHAFGNYRDLLEAVTLSPAMGIYLSMLGNQKADATQNIRADENYAREVMQLFSIGLVQLNPDGTVKLDADGQPIPTYDQTVIENFARVFTGWTYAGGSSFALAHRTNENQVVPMQAYEEQHDADSKTLLTYPGVAKPVLPAGQSAQQDLEDALDNIFNHPNVGPFIARQLIQRLVTSNPSPAYVGRVAGVFNNDGTGERGDLAAVVKAILLDPEARAAPTGDTEGKLKEPILRMVQFLRAYEAHAATGEYRFDDVDAVTGEGHLMSPSVFNFYSPAYAPAGEIADRGLTAPELEIVTEFRATTFANYLYDQIFLRNSSIGGLASSVVVIDISDELALAADPAALVQHVSDKLMGGQISDGLAAEATAAINRIAATKPVDRVEETLFLFATSPEFAVLR